MNLTGSLSEETFMNFPELSLVSLRNNSLSGSVLDFSLNHKLKHIDLSGNRLQGSTSGSVFGLELLESLQLPDNNLTGPVLKLNNRSSLTVLNVSNNNLNGSAIPRHVKSFNHLEKQFNPPSATISENDTANNDDKDSRPNRFGTLFLVFDALGFVALMLLFLLYWRKMKKLKEMMKTIQQNESKKNSQSIQKDSKQLENEYQMEMGSLKEEKMLEKKERTPEKKDRTPEKKEEKPKRKLTFTPGVEAEVDLDDLLKAPAEGLGTGIFGNSYRAKVEEWMGGVVVKRLKNLKPLSNEEFTRQINVVAHYNHPNLLPLLAYHYSKEEKLMVFRYAQNGNLFNRIHGKKSTKERVAFRWNSRLSVARGVAKALEYLHLNTKGSNVTAPPHGNLKSTNILFDENETVLVSDYGLTSMVALPIAAQRMVAYKSPEYQSTKKLSRKSDVWSYGCLVLELLTGRGSIHSSPRGINGVDLYSWVHRAVREEWTAEIFDQEIMIQRSGVPGMLKLLQIGLRCCDKSPDKRPEMSEVVREVENIETVESESEDDLSGDRSFSTDESVSITLSAEDRR